MDNEIIKKDCNETLQLCQKYGFSVYTIDEYRTLISSMKKKDTDYGVKINKLFKSIWRDHDLEKSSTKPEHLSGFVYGLFSEGNIFSTPVQLMDKLFVASLAYIGYGLEPKRPLDHLVYGDSIFDYTTALREKTEENLYIVILLCGVNESDAKDAEAIFQRIFKYEQLPGGKMNRCGDRLENGKIQKPKTLSLFSRIEEFSEYRHLFNVN